MKGGTEILGLSSVPRVQLAFRRKCVEVHFSNVLLNSTSQSWLITSVEPQPRLPLPRDPAPGSNLAPFMSPQVCMDRG